MHTVLSITYRFACAVYSRELNTQADLISRIREYDDWQFIAKCLMHGIHVDIVFLHITILKASPFVSR